MLLTARRPRPVSAIEVVDLVWKGLRLPTIVTEVSACSLIEVVDLVWKGLRQFTIHSPLALPTTY